MLFALLYLQHHVRSPETGDQISFSEAHLDWFRLARRYVQPIGSVEPMSLRDAIIAPRGLGKSTTWFLTVPMWLAAHGHRNFIAAFADSATQAKDHLGTFKRELESNQLLRLDFPELVTPARRPSGVSVSDSQSMYIARNGFVFIARGIDSSVLGMKIGSRRPDHIILDDIEGTEGNYSAVNKEARLKTVVSGILPMNINASVTMAGTVSIPGCIIDDVAKKQRGGDYPAWVDEKRFTPRYYDIIQTDDDGTERSLWPERYPMSWIERERHTRDFRSQFRNDPMAVDGEYWRVEDILHAEVKGIARQVLSIDPAVTATDRSDYTGLAVIGYSPVEQRAVVRDAWQVRIQPGRELRARVLQILDAYPETAGVLIETNQGGDTWRAILHNLPVAIHTVHQSERKEVRAARLLTRYQRGLVVHEKPLPAAEEQMVAFPKAPFDDLVDAIGSGVAALLPKPAKQRPGVRSIGVA